MYPQRCDTTVHVYHTRASLRHVRAIAHPPTRCTTHTRHQSAGQNRHVFSPSQWRFPCRETTLWSACRMQFHVVPRDCGEILAAPSLKQMPLWVTAENYSTVALPRRSKSIQSVPRAGTHSGIILRISASGYTRAFRSLTHSSRQSCTRPVESHLDSITRPCC
jgi:hypothetical protein